MELVTNGISRKAVLAFLYPLIAATVVALTSWVVTGNFNEAEIRTAFAGLGTSGLAGLGAYVGRPGAVAPRDVGPASDDLLGADAHAKIAAVKEP